MTWQPIETAPKDITLILTNGVNVSAGSYSYVAESFDQDGALAGEGGEGWMDWDGGMLPDPTHWQPLPPPPTKEQA